MTELEQLKQIVFGGGFDEDSRNAIVKLEEELGEIAAAEKLLLNPVVKKYVDYLDAEAKRCTYLLSQHKTLTELERQVLFEKREICEHFSSLFTGKRRDIISEEVNDLINVAKAQSNLY
jgi:hypothetical protein